MNCKRVQEFIKTDYIDGRMGDKQKSVIDQHLVHCHGCEVFLISIKKAVNPLKNVQEIVPDKILWAQIKQTIHEEQLQKVQESAIPDFWEKLRWAVHIPRPVFALATVVMLIFMVGLPNQLAINTQSVKVNGQGQAEYLISLLNEPVDIGANNGNDLGTPIEKYFL
ncbi:MAG: zf-HC2 domain-containing protein [Candidatus Omnitrophica bacterium]|nr:zf-HC2 domain-containing protein [Candidatus Omnitrophota bacterium]